MAGPVAEATPHIEEQEAKRGRGRPREKRSEIVQQMRQKYTAESVHAQKQQVLADEFGCSRETAEKARNEAFHKTSNVGNSLS